MVEKPQIIRARGELAKRAVNYKSGFDVNATPAVLARMNEAIEAIKVEAVNELRNKIMELRNICNDATADPIYIGIFRELIEQVAFDTKGMAGTIGLPLMTEIADSLLKFITSVLPSTKQHLDLIKLHIDALYLLAVHGEHASVHAERLMTEGLKKASDKVRASTSDKGSPMMESPMGLNFNTPPSDQQPFNAASQKALTAETAYKHD